MSLKESIIAFLLFIFLAISLIWLFLGLGKIIFGFYRKRKTNVIMGLKGFTFGYFLFIIGTYTYAANRQEEVYCFSSPEFFLIPYFVFSILVLYFFKKLKT